MQEKHKTIISSINGAIAGITATTVTYPLDLMRTVFAGQGIPKQFPTIQSFAMSTFRTRGLVGFYSGLSPTLFQIAPYMGLSFGIYSTLNNITSTHRSEPGSIHWILSYFGNGAIAGFISKLAVYPIDTVKKRMQMREMTRDVSYGKIPYYQTSYECFNDIIRRESIRGLYKGTWPGVLKSVITHSSTFASYEVALHLIKRIKHGN
jgi:solute carrier family 25 thiamine pyrophosphate transporter 19